MVVSTGWSRRDRTGGSVLWPRFVFLTTTSETKRDERLVSTIDFIWLLMSSNNRGLGRSGRSYSTYAGCCERVALLREGWDRFQPQTMADDVTGRFEWHVELDGQTVARSSRSYLRARECSYNLARFLEAVPLAHIAEGTRAQLRRHELEPL